MRRRVVFFHYVEPLNMKLTTKIPMIAFKKKKKKSLDVDVYENVWTDK